MGYYIANFGLLEKLRVGEKSEPPPRVSGLNISVYSASYRLIS